MRRLPALWLAYACLVLSACATTGGTTSEAIDTRLNQAEITATAANDLIADLVTARTITPAQARDAGKAADAVFAAVLTGRALLAAGDATGAQERILRVSAELASLATLYLSNRSAP